MQEPQPERERPPPWTLAEGLRTALSILVRRSPVAIGIWGIALILLGANAKPGREAPPRDDGEIAFRVPPEPPAPPKLLSSRGSIRLVMLAGALVGWTLAFRLLDRLGFTGLHLRGVASGVAGASIAVATLIALPFLPERGAGPALEVSLGGWLMATIVVWIVTADD